MWWDASCGDQSPPVWVWLFSIAPQFFMDAFECIACDGIGTFTGAEIVLLSSVVHQFRSSLLVESSCTTALNLSGVSKLSWGGVTEFINLCSVEVLLVEPLG